jgi:stage V sporulation protein G
MPSESGIVKSRAIVPDVSAWRFTMEITEVRIKLMDGLQDRLLGFCSITFDYSFVVRDLKIIKGSKGAFVAMPSRKLTDRCPGCSHKNTLRAVYCSQCGMRLGGDRTIRSPDGRTKLYADIAHPINSECRDLIQGRVLQAYDEELVLARSPDYICRYDDFGEFDGEIEDPDRWEEVMARREQAATPRHWEHSNHNSSPQARPQDQQLAAKPAGGPEDFGEGVF